MEPCSGWCAEANGVRIRLFFGLPCVINTGAGLDEACDKRPHDLSWAAGVLEPPSLSFAKGPTDQEGRDVERQEDGDDGGLPDHGRSVPHCPTGVGAYGPPVGLSHQSEFTAIVTPS